MVTAEAAQRRRAILAATAGNALEFYDFITYAFFAIQIGHAFFPAKSGYMSPMLSLATFGVGFVTRPIGGIVLGSYADRVGRRPAMMLSFTLMGVAIITIALIPSYATIGIAAPILAVIARMVQGFSLGGEVGPTTAYLLESAPLSGRGLAVSWQGASQGISATVASLVGVALSSFMSAAALDAYGWRIAFLLGAVTLPFGLWIRRGLPETLHVEEPSARDAAAKPVLGLARDNVRIILLSIAALAAGTIGTYCFNYITTFAQNTLHIAANYAFLAGALGNIAGIFAVLWGGWYSDRIGRWPIMVWGNLAYLVLILPCFFWIVRDPSPVALLVSSTILGFAGSTNAGAFYAAFAETLPKPIRGGAFATVYATSIALFGGTTQLVVTWLIQITGNPLAPGWYLFAATIVGQIAYMLILESAPAKMVQPSPAPIVATV